MFIKMLIFVSFKQMKMSLVYHPAHPLCLNKACLCVRKTQRIPLQKGFGETPAHHSSFDDLEFEVFLFLKLMSQNSLKTFLLMLVCVNQIRVHIKTNALCIFLVSISMEILSSQNLDDCSCQILALKLDLGNL